MRQESRHLSEELFIFPLLPEKLRKIKYVAVLLTLCRCAGWRVTNYEACFFRIVYGYNCFIKMLFTSLYVEGVVSA